MDIPYAGTGNYLTLYLNIGLLSKTPEMVLTALILSLARILPIISLSPFLGARVLPHPVKVTLGITLFAIFLPTTLRVMQKQVLFTPELLLLTAKEFLVGCVIGFIMSIPFTIMQNIGFIIDHQRGAASLMVNDPTIQNQSSPFGLLFNYIMIVVFYMINGPFLFFDVINTSYELIPPDQLISSTFFTQQGEFWKLQYNLLQKFMALSVQLAAPSLIIILMTDFFLGIANRLAPQVQITFLGMGVKSMTPILVICIGWQLFVAQSAKVSLQWLEQTKVSIRDMSPFTKLPDEKKESPPSTN